MRPTKHFQFCPQCGRSKIKFRTANEANLFIDYNSDEIREESGYAPVRTYYCKMCGGWHTTSSPYTFHPVEKNHSMRRYYREFAKAAKADNRNSVKEIRAMLHKINRFLSGHCGGAGDSYESYALLYAKAKAMFNMIEDALTKQQRETICRRLHGVKTIVENPRASNKRKADVEWRHWGKPHTLRSHRRGRRTCKPLNRHTASNGTKLSLNC